MNTNVNEVSIGDAMAEEMATPAESAASDYARAVAGITDQVERGRLLRVTAARWDCTALALLEALHADEREAA